MKKQGTRITAAILLLCIFFLGGYGTAYADSGDCTAQKGACVQAVPEDTGDSGKAPRGENRTSGDYLTGIRKKAEALADAGKYDEALALIADAEKVVGYSEDLQALKTEITTRKAVDAITKAYGAGDHLEVVRLYEEALVNPNVEVTFEMTQMYSESKNAYLRAVSDEARTAFENGRDYKAAIAIVQKALAEASFSNALVEELELMLDEYGSYVPVALNTLEPVRQGKYVKIGDNRTASGTFTDVNGTRYDSTTMLYPLEEEYAWSGDRPKDENDCTVVYMLNYQYSTFTGTVFRPYGTLSVEDWNGKYGQVKIYGDSVLLYDSGDIDDSIWEPIHVALNISGIRELKIMISGRWEENITYASHPKHPIVCTADLMLQK